MRVLAHVSWQLALQFESISRAARARAPSASLTPRNVGGGGARLAPQRDWRSGGCLNSHPASPAAGWLAGVMVAIFARLEKRMSQPDGRTDGQLARNKCTGPFGTRYHFRFGSSALEWFARRNKNEAQIDFWPSHIKIIIKGAPAELRNGPAGEATNGRRRRRISPGSLFDLLNNNIDRRSGLFAKLAG